jgi:hypothetical protein
VNNTRILIFIIAFLPLLAPANTNLNVELGQASNSYNKIKINGETGTLFNLRPALDPTLYYRLSLVHKFDSPHGIRFLYAPLKFSGDHRFSKDITFNGVNFPAGKETEAEFKFNSYRGTYFYEVVAKESLFLRVGGTLKVRDAKIELAQDDRKKAKKNTGLVPLLYIFSEYKWANAFRIAFDFDGLMAPQGRAFDLALMTGYYISPSSHINVGYRMLEGGADNDEVYTFSQINYFFTSLQIAF